MLVAKLLHYSQAPAPAPVQVPLHPLFTITLQPIRAQISPLTPFPRDIAQHMPPSRPSLDNAIATEMPSTQMFTLPERRAARSVPYDMLPPGRALLHRLVYSLPPSPIPTATSFVLLVCRPPTRLFVVRSGKHPMQTNTSSLPLEGKDWTKDSWKKYI